MPLTFHFADGAAPKDPEKYDARLAGPPVYTVVGEGSTVEVTGRFEIYGDAWGYEPGEFVHLWRACYEVIVLICTGAACTAAAERRICGCACRAQ